MVEYMDTSTDSIDESKLKLLPIKHKQHSHQCILVLAGGFDEYGNLNPWVIDRLNLVIKEYHNKPCPIICLGGGTYHKPPLLNHRNFVIHEATACCNYLKTYGHIPGNMIYKEWGSYDTIGNVYFSLTNHIQIMEYYKIMIITSKFHMKRTKLLFEWIYHMVSDKYQFIFKETSDDKYQNIVNYRKKREKDSIRNIKDNLQNNIKNIKQFHKWFYTQHKAYSSKDFNIEIIDKNIKNTY